jgi:hypothetical protein
VILIDHFNGRPEATRYLAEVAGEAAVSVITRAEVLAGFDAGDAADLALAGGISDGPSALALILARHSLGRRG